jgi:hypothetical protein
MGSWSSLAGTPYQNRIVWRTGTALRRPRKHGQCGRASKFKSRIVPRTETRMLASCPWSFELGKKTDSRERLIVRCYDGPSLLRCDRIQLPPSLQHIQRPDARPRSPLPTEIVAKLPHGIDINVYHDSSTGSQPARNPAMNSLDWQNSASRRPDWPSLSI